jgi:predicted ATPase
VEHNDEHLYEAEVYRLWGELLLRQGPSDAAKAEDSYRQALAVAASQAKSWQLRAAISLGRLWSQQGKRHEARELLAPVYGWFSEGFSTPDLRDAKSLLNSLE